MDASAVNSYFTPFHYIVYLGVPFIAMICYYQWRWSEICKNNIQVLVAQAGGGGSFCLAPKVGGEVSIKSPTSNTIRTWPVNELSTIDILYPGVGFVPAFLQKTIRLAIVNEGDWEPMLNRSRHYEKVASPDVVTMLTEIAEDASEEIQDKIGRLLKGISTSPTREMIASPAVLGNLLHEKISEVVMTVNKETLEKLDMALKRLGKQINPTIVYVGLGMVLILLAFVAYQLSGMSDVKDVAEDIGLIKQSLGIAPKVVAP